MAHEKKQITIWQNAHGLMCMLVLGGFSFNGVAQVGPPPIILVQPLNQSVLPGGIAIFSVTIVSGTNPGFKWLHNGSYIPGANQSSYAISGVQSADAGQYRVEVRNAGGTVTSSNATLTVLAGTLRATSVTLTPGGFQIHWTGPIGATIVTEASTNLANWTAVATNLALAGLVSVTDPVTNSPSRYYRAYFR